MLTLEKFFNSKGPYVFRYPNDARGISNRFLNSNDIENHEQFTLIATSGNLEKPLKWHPSAKHTATGLNLHLVNKGGGVEPPLTPGYRIIHNLMLVMKVLIENLDNKDYFKQPIKPAQLSPEATETLSELRSGVSYGFPYEVLITFGSNPPKVYLWDGRLVINIPYSPIIIASLLPTE